MPGGSLSLQASPGGLLVPVGCPVLSVWPWRAFLSCFVLSCCVFSPGGLLIPPNFPREILGGGGYKSSGCRGRAKRTEAKAPEDHLPWPPELPAPPWPPELPAPPWPPELPAPPWPPLSVPLWRSPSCVPVRVCSEGPPERPLPGGTVTAWDTPSGRGEICQGSVVCVMYSRLMCPYLVCFLSSLSVIMS